MAVTCTPTPPQKATDWHTSAKQLPKRMTAPTPTGDSPDPGEGDCGVSGRVPAAEVEGPLSLQLLGDIRSKFDEIARRFGKSLGRQNSAALPTSNFWVGQTGIKLPQIKRTEEDVRPTVAAPSLMDLVAFCLGSKSCTDGESDQERRGNGNVRISGSKSRAPV